MADDILKHTWRSLKINVKDKSDKELELSDLALKVARKELREDRSAREQCLEQLLNWLNKNEDVENVRTDDRFLLRFLRAKKFSVPMAQQIILKYLNLKRVFPQMTANLDYKSKSVHEILTNGYLTVSPVRDQHGRRVIIVRACKFTIFFYHFHFHWIGSIQQLINQQFDCNCNFMWIFLSFQMCLACFNPKLYTSYDMAKAHFVALETLLEDPENQVLGFTHICDITGITGAHITNWNPTDFSRILNWGEQSVPARHKAVHLINVPSTVKFVLDFAKSKVSAKMKERFQVHTNIYELHKKVDKSCLPIELGGNIPMSEMIEYWTSEMEAKRDVLVALDRMILHSDNGIVRRHDKNNNNTSKNSLNSMQANFESLSGSFRKLEVD